MTSNGIKVEHFCHEVTVCLCTTHKIAKLNKVLSKILQDQCQCGWHYEKKQHCIKLGQVNTPAVCLLAVSVHCWTKFHGIHICSWPTFVQSYTRSKRTEPVDLHYKKVSEKCNSRWDNITNQYVDGIWKEFEIVWLWRGHKKKLSLPPERQQKGTETVCTTI